MLMSTPSEVPRSSSTLYSTPRSAWNEKKSESSLLFNVLVRPGSLVQGLIAP